MGRTLDTFIHRSGRTARGVGHDVSGFSILLVSPKDEKKYDYIASNQNFKSIKFDGRVLSKAQHRTNLASKIYLYEHTQLKSQKEKDFLFKISQDADIDYDPDDFDENFVSNHDVVKKVEAKRARYELRQLLTQPMNNLHRYGKFGMNASIRQRLLSG